MWRERPLLHVVITFILGNLSGSFLMRVLIAEEIIFHCAVAQLFIISITIIITTLLFRTEKVLLPLYFPLFFLMGYSSILQNHILGGFNIIDELKSWVFIQELREGFRGMITLRGDNELPLLEALTLGDKTNIPLELKKGYQQSGAMHFLALSGLHVGIIYAILSKLFSPLPKVGVWRVMRCVLISFSLVIYALFGGASPSICRAVIMTIIYEIGVTIGREKHGIESLSITALVITLLNPQAPSSISFQLSFSAMLGIFIIYPHLQTIGENMLKHSILIKLWNISTLSISCQLFTTPLTYYHFGTMPLTSILTNTLVMPLVITITPLSPIATLLGDVPLLGVFLNRVLFYLLQIMNLTIEIISRII